MSGLEKTKKKQIDEEDGVTGDVDSAPTPTIGTLEANRVIYLSGIFNEAKAEAIIKQLLQYELANPTKDIILYVDSYGGYIHSFLAIHDAIKMLRCDVATVCIGKAMSCGQMLLISGTKGKRFITPNARVLMHEVSAGHFGKLTDIEIELDETKELQKIIANLITKYTKIKSKDLKTIMQRDRFYSAKQCVELGIVDHIINRPSDLYRKIKV